MEEQQSSVNSEIRFRASEEQLMDELYKRRESHKWLGCLHLPCDKCGRYWFVMSDPTTRTCECEGCWAKRRYLEIVDRKEEI